MDATKTFQFWPGSLELENKPAHIAFAKRIERQLSNCHGYLAYRLTNLGRAHEDEIPSFLLVTVEHGILAIDLLEERLEEVLDQQEQEFWRLDDGQIIASRSFVLQIYEEEIISRLKNETKLYDRKTRKVKIPIRSAIILYKNDAASIHQFPQLSEYDIATISADQIDDLVKLSSVNACSADDLDRVISLLEGTFIYQTRTEYTQPVSPQTYDDFIKLSLKTTFKQDDAQRAISMHLPNGPQRIRGLAGTGKTIVLSLKAALTHKKLPGFKVLYLFNTQSLYSQVQSLITKYYASEAKKAPDFDTAIHVLHAWGGMSKKGLYSELCLRYGITPLNFNNVRGATDPLKVIYGDLLKKASSRLEEIYDLVLIDEAQDFPEEVFETVFKITKTIDGTKRIIWAYDEFQSLKESLIKEPAELFGKAADGQPNIDNSAITGEYAGGIPKDFILPNCYRTPRPVLMTAHGVALGLYGRITQIFFNRKDWEAIGYSVIHPASMHFNAGDRVCLERKDENSKNILERILRENNQDPLSLVQFTSHTSWDDEVSAVADKIHDLIHVQNVPPEEIIIVNLKSGNNKASMLEIQKNLTSKNITSVIPGYIESSDIFKPAGNVTITTPFRAKGNEANIVFVVNAQVVANDFTLRGRNAFFVAASRSRGWCLISGHGEGADAVNREITAIKDNFPHFEFICPAEDLVRSSRTLLSRSDRELDEIQRALATIMRDEALKSLVLSALQQK